MSVDQQAARGPLRVPSASIGAVLEAQVVKPNEEHLEWMEDEAIVERQAITGALITFELWWYFCFLMCLLPYVYVVFVIFFNDYAYV